MKRIKGAVYHHFSPFLIGGSRIPDLARYLGNYHLLCGRRRVNSAGRRSASGIFLQGFLQPEFPV